MLAHQDSGSGGLNVWERSCGFGSLSSRQEVLGLLVDVASYPDASLSHPLGRMIPKRGLSHGWQKLVVDAESRRQSCRRLLKC
jgi:hypothetical protein